MHKSAFCARGRGGETGGSRVAGAEVPMAHAGKNKLFVGSLPSDLTNEELNLVFGTYGTCTDVHMMGGKSTSGQGCAFIVYESADAANNAIAALNGVYSFREDGSPPITVSWARQGGGGGPPGGPGRGMSTLNAVAPPSSLMGFGGGMGGAPIGASTGGYVPLLNAAAGHVQGSVNPPPPPAQPQGMQRTKLFVGNLPTDIQNEAIRMVFSHYGSVTNIHIMQGKSKSGQACAFVEYSTPVEAETAILTLNEKYEIRPGEGAIMVKYANSGGGPRASPY